MKIRQAFLSLCAMLVAAVCGAQVRDGTVEISPFAGYLFGGTFAQGTNALFDYPVDVADHSTYGVRVGYNVTSKLELEAQASHTDTTFVTSSSDVLFGGGGGQDLGGLRIDYLLGYSTFNFGHGRVVPYITAGLGVALLDADVCSGATTPCQNPGQDTRFTASIGGGIKIFANPHFGFRFDGRYYGTWLPTSSSSTCSTYYYYYSCSSGQWLSNGDVSGGLVFAF
ncbi:MAG: acyloxyacyl hydrolase [Thermoanaerobaculia bacterium]